MTEQFRIIAVGHATRPVGVTGDIGVASLPFMFVATARARIEANHSQTLERLNSRGGLCWGELLAGLKDWKLSQMYDGPTPDESAAAIAVLQLLCEWLRSVDPVALARWRPQ